MFWLLAIFAFIFGSAIGSFLNCTAWRLYHDQSLWGRSACPKCHHKIHWYDNIPLLSWLALGGKCRHCQKVISVQYPLVELVTGLLFAVAFYLRSRGLIIDFLNFELLTADFINLMRDWLVISFLVVIFIMDLRWYVVADELSLPAIVIIFVVNLFLGFSWQTLITSAIIGAGFFALQYVVSRGRWVGSGDIRLGALIGVTVGWPNTLVALMLAYFSGAIVGIFLIACKRKGLKSPIPFGVFLAPATLLALWCGDLLYNWYIGLLF